MMISLEQHTNILSCFQIFDYEGLVLAIHDLGFHTLTSPWQKQALVVWATMLTRELQLANISQDAVQTLFNKTLTAIEQQRIDDYQKFALLMFKEYIIILQQYQRFTTNKRVNDMITCMLVNLYDNLTLTDIAASSDISVEYASALFAKHTQHSPIEFYYRLKIERAQFLLVNSAQSLTKISALLCFSDQSHFSKRFKQITGTTPLKYRMTTKTPPKHFVALI
ncbi:MAG: helix-turn-helix transcriptional regulator [Culicoidibacterales bacterium]